MSYKVRRDFVGYGANMPDPKWPNGARLAVNFVMNYEEGSEPSLQDGEDHSDTGLTEAHGMGQTIKGRDLAAESLFEYGSRVGFWRLMRLFGERDLPMTVYGCGLAFERNPEASAAITKTGHDICSHGWRWIKHYELGEAEEREHIAKAIASTEKMIGERPLGWYCRYGPSVNTRELVAEEGGFVYDSDAYNDDLPYWTMVDGKKHLVIPYSQVNNDSRFGAGHFGPPEDFEEHLRYTFDRLYKEGATHPKMMSVGLHMRLAGHPARSEAVSKFIAYAKSLPDVWFAKRIDIARHWQENHA